MLSIKKQNDELKSKIQSKNQEKVDMAATLNPSLNIKSRILGVPLNQFQTPEISKFKTKTIMSDDYSIEKLNLRTIPDLSNTKLGRDSHIVETEDGDFEREETIQFNPHISVHSLGPKSEISSA